MRYFLIVVLSLLSLMAMGQSQVFSGGLFPEAQLTYSPKDNLKLTAKIESQHVMVRNSNETEADFGYSHDRTDFQGFIGTSLNPFISVAGGYQFRWDEGGENSHRSIQQISFVQKKAGYRLGHRVRTDQTFLSSDSPEFRLRYRFLGEIPLNGERIDAGEFYLIASDELISGVQSDEFKLENRVVCSLGFNHSSKQKFEGGIDYRMDSFLDGGLRQRVWLKVGWYVTL